MTSVGTRFFRDRDPRMQMTAVLSKLKLIFLFIHAEVSLKETSCFSDTSSDNLMKKRLVSLLIPPFVVKINGVKEPCSSLRFDYCILLF